MNENQVCTACRIRIAPAESVSCVETAPFHTPCLVRLVQRATLAGKTLEVAHWKEGIKRMIIIHPEKSPVAHHD